MKPSPLPLLLAVTFVGCREPPPPPSQQSIDQAWHRSDQAVQNVADAEQQIRHARRLRDIDRMRFQTESIELQEHLAVVRGLLVALTAVLLIALLWLALEIRRRRILAQIVQHTITTKGEQPLTNETSDRSPS